MGGAITDSSPTFLWPTSAGKERGAPQLEQHRDNRARSFFRDETPHARQPNQTGPRDRVGQTIGEAWTHPRVLIAPQDQRRLRQRAELGVLHVLVVDRAREKEEMIETLLT